MSFIAIAIATLTFSTLCTLYVVFRDKADRLRTARAKLSEAEARLIEAEALAIELRNQA